MNILEKLKPAAQTSDIPTIEARRARALDAFNLARADLGAALADDIGVESARKALASAERTLLDVDALLDAAKARQARADTDADAQAARTKAEAIRGALADLADVAAQADKDIAKLAGTAHAILAAEKRLADLRPCGAVLDSLTTANQAFGLCVSHRLKHMGMRSAMLDDSRARWASYVPQRDDSTIFN